MNTGDMLHLVDLAAYGAMGLGLTVFVGVLASLLITRPRRRR